MVEAWELKVTKESFVHEKTKSDISVERAEAMKGFSAQMTEFY